jgi:hypothetical protein
VNEVGKWVAGKRKKINEIIGSEMETFAIAKYNVIFSIYLMFFFATRQA